jgi:predicted ATPase
MRMMLGACPGLEILASREPLGVAGEIAWRVPSLSLPWPVQPPGDTAVESEAVRLFLERAQEVMPGFAATEHNTAAIAHVCYRLDDVPLAVELAATRVNVLMPEQIADELAVDSDCWSLAAVPPCPAIRRFMRHSTGASIC